MTRPPLRRFAATFIAGLFIALHPAANWAQSAAGASAELKPIFATAPDIIEQIFKEYGLQDANTLEATQTMLESRAITTFPLNDQEVLCRHLHKVAVEYVNEYQLEKEQKEGAKI